MLDLGASVGVRLFAHVLSPRERFCLFFYVVTARRRGKRGTGELEARLFVHVIGGTVRWKPITGFQYAVWLY
jgi:hypothetical protein